MAKIRNVSGLWPTLVLVFVLMGMILAGLLSALSLNMGSLASPGPGLWPAIVGTLGLGLALGVAVGVFGRILQVEANPFDEVRWLRVILFVTGIAGFLILYPVFGFIYSAIPLVFVLLRFTGRTGWTASVIISITAPLILYVVFTNYLGIRI